MKTGIMIMSFSLLTSLLFAQTNYSFPISTIISAGPAGIRLPNGTIVTAEKVVTGIGTHGATSGTSDPNGMGGTFTGTSFLPQYVGSTVPASFTVIGTDHTNTVDNGISNDCARSVGFRIHFDRPTIKISFLALDIDGLNTTPGNAEWVSSFAFNGTTYVPYTQLIQGSADPEAVAPLTINTSSPTHNWRTLITNTLGAATAANLPNSMQIQRGAGSGVSPDNLTGQVIFNPTDPAAPVTDFFFLWGLYRQPTGDNAQASGVSPIVVTVSPDFGDAPDSYKTLLATGGPSHGVVGSLFLGVNENTKPDGQPSVLANLDADDDGVVTVPIVANTRSLSQLIASYSLTTSFVNNIGVAANYVAWIDWNNNGIFEASEAQTATTAGATTSGTVTFTWNNTTLSGTGGRANTYARIRVTTEAITTADVGGAFKDGEVEDYLIPFATVLPLQFLSFSGNVENGHVDLNWKTGNENNTSHFIIERSTDGRNFNSIGQITAMNNGSSQNSYQFTDVAPLQNSFNYYRLKQVDIDNKYSYSSIIRINTNNRNVFTASVTPNPAESVINLIIEGIKERESLSFELMNANGMIVYQDQIIAEGTSMVKIIELPVISKGLYFYRITRTGNMETISGRLILQ